MIETSAENAAKLVAAREEFGFPPNRIDLMTNITGVTFAEAWEHRVEGKLGVALLLRMSSVLPMNDTV